MRDFAPLADAVRALALQIAAGRLITPRALEAGIEQALGAPASSGAWDWRTAYDVLEGASALALHQGAARDLDELIEAERRRPTQTKRSEEQIRLQQFSTPLPYAFVAAEAAAIRADDVVLEPSAGCGALAAAAKAQGAALILNEYDPRRRAILETVFGQTAFGHDGAIIDDALAPGTRPSVVMMNPPFSSSFDRANDQTVAARHCLSALKRLATGGRLVAIMPMAFSPERQPAFWNELKNRARVHLAMVVDGRVYRKNGTTVETQMIVADKSAAGGDDECRFGYVGDIEGATALHALQGAIRRAVPPRAEIERPAPAGASVRGAVRAPARARRSPAVPVAVAPTVQPIAYDVLERPRRNEAVSDVYASYRPQRIVIANAAPHPTPLVESIAMASIAPPPATSRPNVPLKLIEDGSLSEAQLETAIYARDAHDRFLPGRWTIGENGRDISAAREDDPAAVAFRAGFFLGDGTGCGKGRQIAAVMLDNWLAGRRRALWISKSAALFEDACRDWSDVGGAPTDLKQLSRWKPGEPISAASGILFATYATLRSAAEDGTSRLAQIVDWLTADRPEARDDAWGPVIAFDEAHGMGNAAGGQDTGRGVTKASQQGLAGLALQAAIPEARVFYVSATGATTVENLAYATRLGLWGGHPDYPFYDRNAFLTAMHEGGVAAMEVVARDLKAMGLYIARSLSFEGVEYEMMEHPLTDRQRAVYNEWAGAYRIIHQNLHAALRATGVTDPDGACNDPKVKATVMSRFEGLKQRFFNHLLTSMKTPAMVERIRDDLASDRSVVIQLVSTGESLLNRQLDAMSEEERADLSVDLTPRGNVLEYLMNAFPVTLRRTLEDENGNTYTEIVTDPATGEPMTSREAVALRDATIERLAMLEGAPTALDQIVWAFGPDHVAEASGRTKRAIWTEDATGRRMKIEKRPASASASETRAFMDGEKRILVFSEAGGTGRSYHAALNAVNRQKRVHYLLEPGWKADAAVQGLGRTHRSAQASAPLYRVMTTDVAGEKRFVSTIARRLDTLGALTKGQRQTGSQGLFRAEDSLESPIAMASLRQFYLLIIRGGAESVTLKSFEELTGLELTASDGAPVEDLPPMSRFLNRILALEVERQEEIFGEFAGIIAERTEIARETGALDVGVETIRAARLTQIERRVVHVDERTGAETELVTMERADPVRVLTAVEAFESHEKALGCFVKRGTGEPAFVHKAASEASEDGEMLKRVKVHTPERSFYLYRDQLAAQGWEECAPAPFAAIWDRAAAAAPTELVSRFWIATGLLLPVWKHLPSGEQRIWRAITDDGDAVLGRVLGEAEAGAFRAALDPTEVVDARTLLSALVEEQRRIGLSQGVELALRRVGAGPRIEIEGAHPNLLSHLKSIGCFTEIIQWKTRVFIPFDPERPDASLPVLERVVDVLPLAAETAARAA